MPNENQNPKMEFPTNLPQTVKIIKLFSEGDNQYGHWYGYELEHNGQKKTCFANENLHESLRINPLGSIVVITKEEKKKTEGKGVYHIWHVVAQGASTPPPQQPTIPQHTPSPQKIEPPSESHDPATLEQFREDRKKMLVQALQDALNVVVRFNGQDKLNPSYKLNREDIRAIAISFMIKKEKNGG